MQSYKPYARFVTVISAIIIVIAGLDASQVIQLFPEYASQINTILVIAGILAPAIAQEKRVVRAEELVREDDSCSCESDDVEITNDVDDVDVFEDDDVELDDGGA